MATVVSGELHVELSRKLVEIQKQLLFRKGYPYSLRKLDWALQAIVEGKFDLVFGSYPSQKLAADYLPENRRMLDDVHPSLFSPGFAEFLPVVAENAPPLNGSLILQMAETLKANLGLVDCKWLLLHQEEIPVNLRGKNLLFPGTQLESQDGDGIVIPGIHWREDEANASWVMDYVRLTGEFDANDFLVRVKQL